MSTRSARTISATHTLDPEDAGAPAPATAFPASPPQAGDGPWVLACERNGLIVPLDGVAPYPKRDDAEAAAARHNRRDERIAAFAGVLDGHMALWLHSHGLSDDGHRIRDAEGAYRAEQDRVLCNLGIDGAEREAVLHYVEGLPRIIAVPSALVARRER